MGDFARTQGVQLAVQLADLDGGQELEVFAHEPVIVQVCDRLLLPFGFECRLEYLLGFALLQGIHL